jgi:hypothetical protein
MKRIKFCTEISSMTLLFYYTILSVVIAQLIFPCYCIAEYVSDAAKMHIADWTSLPLQMVSMLQQIFLHI